MAPIRSLTLSLLLICSLPAMAQIAEGAKLQFGAADLFLLNRDNFDGSDGKTTTVGSTISYGVLYLLSDHWALGGGLGTFASSQLEAGVSGILPTARYYFNPGSTGANWFATTGAGFSLVIGDNPALSFDQYIIGGGFNHFLNRNVILETGLNIAFFNNRNSIFRNPEFSLGTGLLVYLTDEDWSQRKALVPSAGRGSWLIGINAAHISYRPGEQSTFFSAMLQPNIGYFFTDHLVGGLSLTAGYSDSRLNSDRADLQIDYFMLTLGAGAYSRFYLGSPEQRLRPFGHAEVGLVSVRSDYRSAFSEDFAGNDSWLTTRFGVGANLFLGPQVALEGTFSYSSGKEYFLSNQTFDRQRLGFDVGFQFFLGKAAGE